MANMQNPFLCNVHNGQIVEVIKSPGSTLNEARSPGTFDTAQEALNVNIGTLTTQVNVGNTTGLNTPIKPRHILVKLNESVVQRYLASNGASSSSTDTSTASLASTTGSMTSPSNGNRSQPRLVAEKTLITAYTSTVTPTASNHRASGSNSGGLLTTVASRKRVATKRSRRNVVEKNRRTGSYPYERINPGALNAAAGNSVSVSESTVLQPAAGVRLVSDGVKLGVASISQGIPEYDFQEPGSGKDSENLRNNISKQNNQNPYEEMGNELMCTICANLFIKAVTLGCSHSFCQYCIGEWKKKKTECPICKKKITSISRTLVLDNITEKMLETAPKEDKQDRAAAMEGRKDRN